MSIHHSNEVDVTSPWVVEPDEAMIEADLIWTENYSKKRVCKRVEEPLVSIDTPIYPNKIRFVCISDTHGKLRELAPRIPDGDVLIHAGDFTNFGEVDELAEFNEVLGTLPHRYKIVIAGNHELGFEDDEDESKRAEPWRNHGTPRGYKLLTNCTYLHDNSTEVHGIKVYGSSWHSMGGFSFSRNRGEDLLKEWRKVGADVDVLVTHAPPLGHSDIYHGLHSGDADLLDCVENRIHPRFHIFGHCHEQWGITTNDETIFINASICSHTLEVINTPILFDIPADKTGV